MYDRLDRNGDHSLDMDELKNIANLHVKNELTKLENMKQPLDDKTDQDIYILEQQLLLDIKKLNNNFENRKNEILKNKINEITKIDDEIKQLKELSDQNKTEKFRKAITNKNGNISFCPFFEYMKNRTNDIPNIEW